jgi:putative DNA primase/helicase
MDSNDMLLGVGNGVYELATKTFRDGIPEDYISKQCKAEWKGANEKCPQWESFLAEVQPDPEVLLWLQKFAGYCLSGKANEQIFTVFQGSGANGKSVFVEMLKLVLGTYATTVQFESFCEKDKSSTIRNDIAMLDKIRLVVANEGPEGARLDEGMVKQVTGGDDYTARFKP